jgi:hypothetical protein
MEPYFALETGALPMLLWIVFLAAAMLSIALGAILSFHWLRYAMHPAAPVFAIITYASICFACLSVMLGVVALPA